MKKIVSIQRETTVCDDALETRWTGPTDFARTDTASHKLVPVLETLTTAIAKSAIAWGTAKRGKAGPKKHDPMWLEVRRLGVERRCEMDPHKWKNCPSHLTELANTCDENRPTSTSRRRLNAPSRLQGPPPPTRAPILEKLGADGTVERVDDLDGRTSIVHQHF